MKTMTMEERVKQLEKRVAELKASQAQPTVEKVNEFAQLISSMPKDDFGKIKPSSKTTLQKTNS